jgi:hypothetical protein
MWAAWTWMAGTVVAAPVELTWQARLTDSGGAPVDGPVPIEVRLYGSASGTDVRWQDDFAANFADGFVSLTLGTGQALDHGLFATGDLWVELRHGVAGTPMGPRQRISHSPRAVMAEAIRVEGAATTSSCAGQTGAIVYDTTLSALRLCDGTQWIRITDPPETGLAVNTGALQYADGQMAASCKEYANPGPGRADATSDGLYRIDPPGSVPPFVVECNMSLAGGGWTLIANRRANNANIEACGSNLAGFFTAGCGTADAAGPTSSYAMTAAQRTSLGATEMLFTQYLSGGFDADDAYVLGFGNATDLFPNSTASNNIAVGRVCNLAGTLCDNTDVYWKFLGSGHYSGTVCNQGQDGGAYGGNYGYCQNGISAYTSSGLIGDRAAYNETKLWNYPDAQAYQERLWYR